MRTVAIVALMALVAAVAVDASPDFKPASRSLKLVGKLFGRDPNGFSVGAGIGLGATVDDIEASVDLGPFGFTLDPAPTDDEEEEAAPVAPAPPPCDKYCDPYTGAVCCLTATGCVPNGEVVPGCGVATTAHTGYTYGYGRK